MTESKECRQLHEVNISHHGLFPEIVLYSTTGDFIEAIEQYDVSNNRNNFSDLHIEQQLQKQGIKSVKIISFLKRVLCFDPELLCFWGKIKSKIVLIVCQRDTRFEPFLNARLFECECDGVETKETISFIKNPFLFCDEHAKRKVIM